MSWRQALSSRSKQPLAAAALLLGVFGTAVAHAQPWEKPGYDLVFHDEFDGSEIDTTKWRTRYPWGEAQINGELQGYGDDQFSLENGILTILGEQKQIPYAGMSFDYASGVITSLHTQTYGYFEARVKCPQGQGLWPAFWLYAELGSGRVDEIDILELLGHEPTEAHMTLHWGDSYDPGHHFSEGSSFVGPDFSLDFHTFAVDWTPDRVAWLIDDVERFSYSGPDVPQSRLYLIANLAIGGTWPGPPDPTTVFPARYEVDYIRAYTPAEEPPDAGAAGSDSGGAGGSHTGGGGATASGGSDGGVSASPSAADGSAGDCGCRVFASPGDERSDAVAALLLLWAVAAARRREQGTSGSPQRSTRSR